MMVRKMIKFIALSLLVGFVLQPVYAGIIISVEEVGSDVKISFTGTFNTSASLSGPAYSGPAGGVIATDAGSFDSLYIALGGGGSGDGYQLNVTGPTSFGTNGSFQTDTSSSGDQFVFFPFINSGQPEIGFKTGYISGELTSGSSTFSGKTIDSMGLTAGNYQWIIGNSDMSITDTVSLSVVPEPASILMIALGAGGLLFSRRLRV